jgi:hypothetical protein
VAGVTPARALAATWRNENGDVVGTTSAKTMCLWPRLPWRIRFHRDGFEGVVPCRECPGCLELERLRLAERLHKKYGVHRERRSRERVGESAAAARRSDQSNRSLFVVRIWAPLELHATIAHAMHRRRGLDLVPGWARLGAGSFALLSRDKSSPGTILGSLGLKHRIEPLRLSRGRRAWRPITAGLLVAREIYGEDRNRFYFPGLAPAEREKWEVRKIGSYQSYDRYGSPRAWTGSKLVLVPPEVWRLSRTDRRSLRGKLLRQPDPEGVARVMRMVSDVVGVRKRAFTVSAAPKAPVDTVQLMRSYRHLARGQEARSTVPASPLIQTPSSEEGGYTSSEHSQGELLPKMVNGAPAPTPDQRRERRVKWEIFETLERIRKKATGHE